MQDMMRNRWRYNGALAAGSLTVLALLGACNGERSNACTTDLGAAIVAPQSTYAAKIRKTTCVAGAELTFAVVLDRNGKGPNDWTYAVQIETDKKDPEPPQVEWSGPASVKIVVPTRTLRGTLIEHVGQDLRVERQFVPQEPDAFPNFF